MILILCEKPSVAKDIAKGLSKNYQTRNGYFLLPESNIAITWAFGHLFTIDESIAPKNWTWDTLPIFPERFKYVLLDDPGVKKQFRVIKDLLSKASKVIIATDAGEEGELIARLILHHAGWNNWQNTFRLWTSEALTPDVVSREIKYNLKLSSNYDSLFWSALARQHADWLVGINLSRAVTLQATSQTGDRKSENKRSEVWSVGRVQTPTLYLIVKRTLEIENFKPEPYWMIKAKFEKNNTTFSAYMLNPSKLTSELKNSRTESVDYIAETNENAGVEVEDKEENKEERGKFGLTEEFAKKVFETLKDVKYGVIKNVRTRLVKEKPPSLHSLTSLQREANKLYGFSATKTLNIAQKLYEERKCISYPRTESRFLAESSRPLVLKILHRLGYDHLQKAAQKAGKEVFDDSKLTDHHAIIPLAPLPENASPDEKKIYDLILRRFIGIFMPEYHYEVTEVWIDLKGYIFYTKGKRDIQLGWRKLYKEEAQESTLPPLKTGERLLKKDLSVEKRFTSPPPPYTEGSILKRMETLNLGTPATRNSIIDTLKLRQYVILQGKQLLATPKGKELVLKLEKVNSRLISPELTGEWEKRRNFIYKENQGKSGYLSFINSVKDLVVNEINLIKKQTFTSFTTSYEKQKNSDSKYRDSKYRKTGSPKKKRRSKSGFRDRKNSECKT